MSLLFSLLMKMDAGQAKTELRSLQTELTKTGTGAKVLGVDAKGASIGVDVLGDQSAATANKLELLDVAQSQTAASAGRLGSGSILAGNSARMLGQQISQVGQQTMATGQFVQALAIQLPDIGIGFGAVGGAIGLLAGIALPLLASAFATSGARAQEAAEKTERLRAAYDGILGATAASQSKVDQLRFGVDEDYQVELLKEQIRLSGEFNAKKAELVGYSTTTTDSLDRQKITTEGLRAEITAIADQYSKNAGLLADQENRAVTLAVIEGQRAQVAGELAARQAEATQAAEQQASALSTAYAIYAESRAEAEELANAASRAGVSAEQLSAIGFGNISGAATDALRLAGNLGIALNTASRLSGLGPQGVGGNDPSGKVYGGRGGAPTQVETVEMRLGYVTPPKVSLGGGTGSSGGAGGRGGGAAAARAEKDAVAELITKLKQEQETLRETDPVKQELMKHRKTLADATAAERTEVENLIRAEQQLKAVRAAEDFASQSAADFLDAIIVQGASAEDALKSLLSSLIKVGIQALMLGQGPLAGILGTNGGLFSGMFGGGGGLPFMAAGGYVQALAAGGDATPRLAADARRMPARDASSMRRLTAGDAMRFAAAARQSPVNGLVTGEGGPRADKVPTWLSAGEYVVNGRATAQYRPLLERINAGGGVPGYAAGGMIGAARGAGDAMGGLGGSARGDTHIHIHGAMGNTEIQEMVQAGVQAGIEANNTHVLPDRVMGILQSPRVR